MPRHDNEARTAVLHDQKVQMAWALLESLQFQVQIADRKVHAVFGANTLLVAALSFQGQNSYTELQAGGLNLFEMVGLVARGLLITAVCASALFAIFALLPRVRKPLGTQQRGGRGSAFFFGDIAAQDEQKFTDLFLHQSHEEAARQILAQSHNVAQVVSEKYRWTRRAATSLITSIVLWVVVLIVKYAS